MPCLRGKKTPTFRNLTIDGHIYEAYTGSEAHHVGGLIGHLFGTVTIEHCTSNVSITTTGGAGGFVGLCEHTVNFTDCMSSAVIRSAGGNNSGFVGWSRASGHEINFTGCVFNGKLLQIGDSGNSNGGLIGWTGSNKTVTITDCLVDPAALSDGETMADGNSATFARGWNATTTATNSYYTAAIGTAQGKQAHSITAGENVTLTLSSTATEYSVSGITAYTMGLKYNVYYAGNGDIVALTLGITGEAPAGYEFSGYTASAGTLAGNDTDGYTLTMPDENVTITPEWTAIYHAGDVNGDGTISVADVALLVNYLLDKENDSFIIKNADVDGDGSITATDITVLVNMILDVDDK